MANFILDFIDYCKETEIPGLFSLWCGISTLSCALSRRVWLDMGHYQVYPNLYIILVAGSGRCRKSTAIDQAANLLEEMEPKPNLISQKITNEALIEAIKITETNDHDHFLRETAEGFVIADELSVFLNAKSYEAGLASTLIQFFDCKKVFKYHTKGRGIEKLTNICLGMLSASTVDWIRSAIPFDAIGGGLTSRMIFVYVEDPPPPVAITRMSKEKLLIRERMLKDLRRVQSIEGPFVLSPEAEALYISHYNKFANESPFFHDMALSGYASRRFFHALKIAIIMSVSDSSSKPGIISPQHFETAVSVLHQTEQKLPQVMAMIVANEKGAMKDIVYRYIHTRRKVRRSDLMLTFSHRIDARELDLICDTLIQSGLIEKVLDGSTMFYELVRGQG